MLPCIGSHDHTTLRPSRLIARTIGGKQIGGLVGTDAADQRQPAGFVVRIEDVDQPQQLIRLLRRPGFQAERVLDAAAIFDMGMIELPRAVADPDHMAPGAVPVAGRRIDARESLLIAEQQRLMAGEEIGRAHFRMHFRIDAAGVHEVECFGQPVGKVLIALRLRASP